MLIHSQGTNWYIGLTPDPPVRARVWLRHTRPSLVPSWKKWGGGGIRLHTFRQEFERANRNATFFNRCNSEDGKCELQVHSFTILACVWLQLRQLTS